MIMANRTNSKASDLQKGCRLAGPGDHGDLGPTAGRLATEGDGEDGAEGGDLQEEEGSQTAVQLDLVP